MSLINDSLKEIFRQSQAEKDILSANVHTTFWRQFSVSGLSTASSPNYNLAGRAGPATLQITPYPGENKLLIRAVKVTISDGGTWTSATLGGQTAPSPALTFKLFRSGSASLDFAPGNNSFGYSTNASFVRGSDDYSYLAAWSATANLLELNWRFDSQRRAPIVLGTGDSLQWTLPAGADLSTLSAITIAAAGALVP